MNNTSERQQDIGHPKVTVLMAVYNGERFLRETIDSILGQTFKDYEFLIIDDGSTDSSRDIILSYDDCRIRLIDNPNNLGLTKSLNRGLAIAKGGLIARQDADDISHPTRLEKQVAFMEENPNIALLGTQARLINEFGRSVRQWITEEKAQSEEAIHWQFLFDNPFVHTSVMFRRDIVWNEYKGYNEDCIISQDYELWSRIGVNHSVSNLPNVLVDSRIHQKSVMANYDTSNVWKAAPMLAQNLRRYLKTNDIPNEWPDLWVQIRNWQVVHPPENPGSVIEAIDAIYHRFMAAHPGAEANSEIQRHLSKKWLDVAFYLIHRDKTNSLKAYVRGYLANAMTAMKSFPKYFMTCFVGKDTLIRYRNNSTLYNHSDQ